MNQTLCGEVIHVCSNEGPHSFPRGDNIESVNNIENFKKSSSWVEGIHV